MPFGLTISVLFHIGVLAWALVGLSTTAKLKFPEEIPVEVSIISAIDLELKQKKGDSLSKIEEAAVSAGKQPSPKDAPKPKPIRAVEPPPPAAAEPPPAPPEPVKVEPPKPPEPVKAPEPPPPPKLPDQIAALIEKPPAPPIPDGPTPEEKKQLEDKLAEQQRLDEARAKAETEAKKQADDKKKAEDKKKADEAAKKKLAEDKKKKEDADRRKSAELAKKSKSFDQQMAELLNKVPDQPSASAGAETQPVKPATAKGPTAGTKTGTDNVNKARAEQMLGALLNSAFKECWSKPSAGGGVTAPAVRVKWSLNADGTLNGEPKVVDSDRNSPLADQAERAAIRAVQTCVPFQLPPEHYALWREINWNFNPNQP